VNADRIIGEGRENARGRRVQLQIVTASSENEIDTAFAALVRLRACGLAIAPDTFLLIGKDSWWNLRPTVPSR
jgi:hypothetical protein